MHDSHSQLSTDQRFDSDYPVHGTPAGAGTELKLGETNRTRHHETSDIKTLGQSKDRNESYRKYSGAYCTVKKFAKQEK